MTASHPIVRTVLPAFCGWIFACLPGVGQTAPPRAPVDSAETVEKKNVHVKPDSGEAQPADWTLMQAWNRKSDLAQTGHIIRPAGTSLRIKGRVMSLALAKGGKFLVAKTAGVIAIVDADTFRVVMEYPFPEEKDGGSMYGLAVSPDGVTIYFTGRDKNLYSGTLDDAGTLVFGPTVNLATEEKASPNPLGIALTPDAKQALVCLAVANQVAVVDLSLGKVMANIPVGVCPYGVALSPDGRTAFVSNFGGSRARPGDKTEISAGTEVAVDARSVALRGTVSVIDMQSRQVVGEIETGIHPEALTLSPDGKQLYVVNASGDGIAVIDISGRKVINQLCTKPQADLPYGSLTTGVAASADGKTLFAANAGNNAIALINPSKPADPPYGFLAAGGFPGALALRNQDLFIGNVIGYYGNLQKVVLPASAEMLDQMTAVAKEGFHHAEMVRAQARAQSGVAPKPVPDNPGEPSPIRHVVYIIKENKKFDQVLGDIGRGNCEPKFCEFPRATTPNTHALADRFVLLDNYYCNGVLSCDGHQWADQGLSSPIREKDWNNKHITYNFGQDPLCFAGCGFIWDHLLLHGISFRNFGELAHPLVDAKVKWTDNHKIWKEKTGRIEFTPGCKIAALRQYSDPRYPGWDMEIPDQFRADAFLTALGEFEQAGKMPEFVIIYLPNDHTKHGAKGSPTPRAYVADNDLATGRVVEALSKSRFWKDMVVFANEDDPQTGNDHVDGHRSFCLLAGPYVKRGGTVISRFYNQDSVLHTICRIFGVPPMNQMVAMAPVMSDCFQDTPDFTPYVCLAATVPIDELNPDPKKATSKNQAKLAPLTEKLDFSAPDQIDKHAELFSRWVWSTVRGDEPFPEGYMGAHGKGLAALGLRLDPNVVEDDD